MKRLLCFLIPLLLAAPAFAGTVYVPYAADFQLGGVTYETRVWVTNSDRGADSSIEYLYLATFRDGTEREDMEATELVIPAGQTITLAVGGPRGMLEIFAPEEIQVHARLVAIGGSPAGQGFDLPILSSDNVVPAGGQAHVLGWERLGSGAQAYTNFGLLNLGHDSANCLVDVLRNNGTQAVDDFAIVMRPLSHNEWGSALGILGVSDALGWRAVVTCDQPFYSYAAIRYPETSRMTFVGPSAGGESELQRPGGGGVSDQFDYLSDLPIDRWGGIEIRPFINTTGIDWHPSGGGPPVGGIAPIKINGTTYEKGLSFYPRWSSTGFVEYKLNGEYALFTAVVRVADHYRGAYEWAVVSGGRWIRLERPSDGYRGVERSNPIRVGSALTFQVLGDGQTLFASPEIYAYGDAVLLEIDVTGVDVLRLQTHPDGTEQLSAPHRNGLSSPRVVGRCPWLDMVSFADPKVFKTN